MVGREACEIVYFAIDHDPAVFGEGMLRHLGSGDLIGHVDERVAGRPEGEKKWLKYTSGMFPSTQMTRPSTPR